VRRLALAVVAQSVAMMPQPIALCIADIFTEKEIVYSSHLVVLTLRRYLGAGERPTESATDHAEDDVLSRCLQTVSPTQVKTFVSHPKVRPSLKFIDIPHLQLIV
jgi:hypothetical protein